VTIVVAAIIERDGAYLLTRRLEGTHLAGLWEFPGGKVTEGESHAEALAREIREELDTPAHIGSRVFDTVHDYGDRTIALHFYRCVIDREPRAALGQQIRWVPRAELATLDFPPADAALIKRLMESPPR